MYVLQKYHVKFNCIVPRSITENKITSVLSSTIHHVDEIFTLPLGIDVLQYIRDNYVVFGSIEVEFIHP